MSADKLKEYREKLQAEIEAWEKLEKEGQYQLGQTNGLKRAMRLLDEIDPQKLENK